MDFDLLAIIYGILEELASIVVESNQGEKIMLLSSAVMLRLTMQPKFHQLIRRTISSFFY